jgi:hypothetical protein
MNANIVDKTGEHAGVHNTNLIQTDVPQIAAVLVNDQNREDLNDIDKSPPVISNRFAALVDVDLGDATGNIEENLNRMVHSSTKEDDIENDDDESSTAETDFVDAT